MEMLATSALKLRTKSIMFVGAELGSFGIMLYQIGRGGIVVVSETVFLDLVLLRHREPWLTRRLCNGRTQPKGSMLPGGRVSNKVTLHD